MKRTILALLAMVFLCPVMTSLKAQDNRCGSSLDLHWLQVNDQAAYQRFMDVENLTTAYITTQSSTTARLIDPNGLIIIPVVVHVLHRNGEGIGAGLNISMAQIESQIVALNEDFRRLNADRVNTPARFVSRAADLNIEFRLARWDPNGIQTDGIVRKATSQEQFRMSDDAIIKSEGKGSAPWQPSRYLNIWVCNLIGDLGYSVLPSNFKTKPHLDGIVVTTNAFGTTGTVSAPYHLGGTATHEVGHWLNLRHIWGDEYCGNDFVGDTPTQQNMTALNYCPTNIRTSLCNEGPEGDMYMNFMDFTIDDCTNLFTNGQRLRARALFASVNGVDNARVEQLKGFFGFTGQPSAITCKGTFIVSPMDLPVTWTVSGPATISSGVGTSKIELNATGNGAVHLTASSGNFFAETDVSVTYQPTPSVPTITDYKTSAPGDPTAYHFTATPMQNVRYDWYYYNWNGSGPILQQTGMSNEFDAYFACRATADVYCKVVNTCGTSTSNTITQTGECIRTKEAYLISPNPASSTMTVSTVDASNGETSNNYNISEVKIYDQMGLLKKQAKYGNVKTAAVNISTLPTGIYMVEIISGDYKEQKQLFINR